MSSAATRPAAQRLEAAFLWACRLDVATMKPGNVSLHAPGHDMTAQDFLTSAAVSAPPLLAPGAPVGERIEGAVRATRAAVGCNTNLGILLLCAPLAAAHDQLMAQAIPVTHLALRQALADILNGLTVADAAATFRAITVANPGGLGRAEEGDVTAPATITLREAMALAAERDTIARQYISDFADVLDAGLTVFRRAEGSVEDRVRQLFMHLLAAGPDSHLVRKYGIPLAQSVTAQAKSWLTTGHIPLGDGTTQTLAEWDQHLKKQGINPGTSADMTVATLFCAAILGAEPIQSSPF